MSFTLTGRHVLFVILGFFGVTIAVNAVFVTLALDTFRGEDVSSAYSRGLDYNAVLAERSAQRALGWTAAIDAARDAATGHVRVIVSITDGAGQPVRGLSIAGVLRHPSDAALDQTFAMAERSDAYEGAVEDARPGQWDIAIAAQSAEGVPFEGTRRLWLR